MLPWMGVLAVLAGCSAGTPAPLAQHSSVPDLQTQQTAATTLAPSLGSVVPDASLTCDPLDERACLLPWPNDAFTVADPSTTTGRRLAIHATSPPPGPDGVVVDVTDVNRADGFSSRSVVLTLVPGIDLDQSHIPGRSAVSASLDDDAPIVLLDTTTGQRVRLWAELDLSAPVGDQLLMIHPAVEFAAGHHIVVALRHLTAVDGTALVPTTAFQAALDGTPEPDERRRAFRDLFEQLDDNGVPKASLYVAWDFTVASKESLDVWPDNSPQIGEVATDDGSDPVERILSRQLSEEG